MRANIVKSPNLVAVITHQKKRQSGYFYGYHVTTIRDGAGSSGKTPGSAKQSVFLEIEHLARHIHLIGQTARLLG